MRTKLYLFLMMGAMGAAALMAQTLPAAATFSGSPAEAAAGGVFPQNPGAVQAEPQQKPTPATTPGPAAAQAPVPVYVPYGDPDEFLKPDTRGSAYIPVDSWVYPAMLRLYSLGYADTLYLSMRPWTRRSVLHILEDSKDDILEGDGQEAKGILAAVMKELEAEPPTGKTPHEMVYGLQSAYTRGMGVSGTTLRDSYHLGQTINNDYGRPYESGF